MARASSSKVKLKNVLVAKGAATSALVERLRALHQELETLEQDTVDVPSLKSTAAELISKSLLTHKDKSVKAYTAVCLADILKLHAPDAPYNDKDLSDIFAFFFTQLRNLSTKNDPQLHQYHYLLRNLGEVRTICIVCELSDAEKMMNRAFEELFDLLTIELLISDILSQLVDEMDTVPSDVIDRILAQYVPKNAKKRPSSLRVAKDLCDASNDKLQRYVSQYFTEVLGRAVENIDRQAGLDSGDEEDEALDDIAAIKKAHDVIQELQKVSPGLLLNVIPQLEVEMAVEKESLRIMVTKTIGRMLAGNQDLAAKYGSLWSTWLNRALDKSAAVRIACLEGLRGVWSAHPIHSKEIQEALVGRLDDPDDKVRLAACTVFHQLDFETALNHLDVELLKTLADRIKDKKILVATEALKAASRLYSLAYPSIERLEEKAVEQFSWIPNVIFDCLSISDHDIQAQLQNTIGQDILPLPSSADDEEIWVDRLMLTFSVLDPKQRKALLKQTHIATRNSPFATFVDACEKYNGGVIDENEKKVTAELKEVAQRCSQTFPEASKACENLIKFAKLNENRLYKLLRAMMNPHSDLKTIIKAHNEFVRKAADLGGTLPDTMMLFMRRSGLLLLCQSALPALLRRVQSPGDGINGENALAVAKELLQYVADNRAAMFSHHLELLIEGLDDAKNTAYVDTCLLALSTLAKAEPSSVAGEPALRERCGDFIQGGTVFQAKAAATILALDDTAGDTDQLISDLVDGLPAADGPTLVVHVNALSRFARHAPALFDRFGETVTTFVLEEVLASSSPEEMEVDAEADWADDKQLDSHSLACLASLKVLTNRLRGFKDAEEAEIISKPIYKLLYELLDSGGDVHGVQRRPAVAARLRSLASTCLLRLASSKAHEWQITENFDGLAWTMQDPVFQVRSKFLEKTTQYLFRQRLTHPIFNIILFLVAHDPEDENRNMAKANIVNRARIATQDVRTIQFEAPLMRMLHLLAHHPDFNIDREEIVMTSKYIQFFLECVATQSNIAFLRKMAQILKYVRDKKTPGNSDNLYAMSELADHMIIQYAEAKKWTPLKEHPGTVTVPKDLFGAMPSPDVAKAIKNRQYLSKEILDAVTNDLGASKAGAKKLKGAKSKGKAKTAEHTEANGTDKPASKPKKKRKSEEGATAKAKKSKPASKSGTKKKAPAKKRKAEMWDSDAEQSEEEVDLGGTSEEEAKPKGSRSRPRAKPKPSTPRTNGRHHSDDEVEAMLSQSPKTKKKASPKRPATKKAKTAHESDEPDDDDDDGATMTIDETGRKPDLNDKVSLSVSWCLSFVPVASEDAILAVMPAEQIAFVGLGNMGVHMAANLANSLKDRGCPPLIVWNRTASKAKEVASDHVEAVNDLAQVAHKSDIIVSCLGTDAAVEQVWDDIIPQLKEGTLVLEQSTVDPALHRDLAQRIEEKKAHFLGANIFGPVPAAKAAQLVLALAGPEAQRKRAEALLVPALARACIHLGDDSSLASTMKLIGNGVVVGVMEICAQAITLADKTGVTGEKVLEFFKLMFNSSAFIGYSEKMLNNHFVPPGFNIAGGLKDVQHIRNLAASVQTPCPVIDIAHEHMRTAQSLGNPDLDWSSLVMAHRMAAGLRPDDRFAANDSLPKEFGRH